MSIALRTLARACRSGPLSPGILARTGLGSSGSWNRHIWRWTWMIQRMSRSRSTVGWSLVRQRPIPARDRGICSLTPLLPGNECSSALAIARWVSLPGVGALLHDSTKIGTGRVVAVLKRCCDPLLIMLAAVLAE